MGLAPRHRVSHTPKVVLSMDSAWDHDRYAAEMKAIKAGESAWEKPTDHPLQQYIRGDTRCDLDLVRAWLNDTEKPVVFTLRKMTLKQWLIYKDEASVRPSCAQALALRMCLLSVDGADVPLNRGSTEAGVLDDGDMDRVRELTGDDGFEELGRHAANCSRELLEPEKKP